MDQQHEQDVPSGDAPPPRQTTQDRSAAARRVQEDSQLLDDAPIEPAGVQQLRRAARQAMLEKRVAELENQADGPLAQRAFAAFKDAMGYAGSERGDIYAAIAITKVLGDDAAPVLQALSLEYNRLLQPEAMAQFTNTVYKLSTKAANNPKVWPARIPKYEEMVSELGLVPVDQAKQKTFPAYKVDESDNAYPVVEAGKPVRAVMQNYPTFKASGANMIIAQVVADMVERQLTGAGRLHSRFNHTVRWNLYGAPSPTGLFQRLLVVRKNFLEFNENNADALAMPDEFIADYFSKQMGIRDVSARIHSLIRKHGPKDANPADPSIKDFMYAMAAAKPEGKFKGNLIDMNAEAGPPFRKLSKGETVKLVLEWLGQWTDEYTALCQSGVKLKDGSTTNVKLGNLSKLSPQRLAHIARVVQRALGLPGYKYANVKAKSEATKRSKPLDIVARPQAIATEEAYSGTKTRAYMAGAAVGMAGPPLASFVHQSKPAPLQGDLLDTLSRVIVPLKSLPIEGGGFDLVARRLLGLTPFEEMAEEGGLVLAHYSDNFYANVLLSEPLELPSSSVRDPLGVALPSKKPGFVIIPAGARVYLSLDGAKFETSHTETDLLKQATAFADQAGLPPKLAAYYLLVAAQQETNITGILNRFLYPVNYLATGAAATFDRNDCKMYAYCRGVLELLGERAKAKPDGPVGVSVEELLLLARMHRINLTVESVIITHDPDGQPMELEPGVTYPGDLLGYDFTVVAQEPTVTVPTDTVIVPTLSRGFEPGTNRFDRALFIGSYPEKDPDQELFKVWSRLTCLLYLGGFLDGAFLTVYADVDRMTRPLLAALSASDRHELADDFAERDSGSIINAAVLEHAMSKPLITPADIMKFYGVNGGSVLAHTYVPTAVSAGDLAAEYQGLQHPAEWDEVARETLKEYELGVRSNLPLVRTRVTGYLNNARRAGLQVAKFEKDKLVLIPDHHEKVAAYALLLPQSALRATDVRRAKHVAESLLNAHPDVYGVDEGEIGKLLAHREAEAARAREKINQARVERRAAKKARKKQSAGPALVLEDFRVEGGGGAPKPKPKKTPPVAAPRRRRLTAAQVIKLVDEASQAIVDHRVATAVAAAVEKREKETGVTHNLALRTPIKMVQADWPAFNTLEANSLALKYAVNSFIKGEPGVSLPDKANSALLRPTTTLLFRLMQMGALQIAAPPAGPHGVAPLVAGATISKEQRRLWAEAVADPQFSGRWQLMPLPGHPGAPLFFDMSNGTFELVPEASALVAPEARAADVEPAGLAPEEEGGKPVPKPRVARRKPVPTPRPRPPPVPE